MNKTDVERISGAFARSAELLGNKNPQKSLEYGFIPGMGRVNDAKVMNGLSKQIRDGLFMFLVMGRFSTGKSTLINTMLNENVLATKITPATGIIAQIENGEPGRAVVYFEDENHKPEEMNESMFFKRFTLTPEDVRECEETGAILRFSDVKFAVLRRKCKLIENGVRLVDSPGLDESISQTKTTEAFLPHANAIIFVMSSLDAFNVLEKDYINRNFAGKNPKNVFFVFTRADNISSDENFRLLQENARKMLDRIFSRPDNTFDEQLFNNRTFYVDAFHSGQIRTEGRAYNIDRFGNETPCNFTLEQTEIPALERAVQTFLDSDEKAVSQYRMVIGQAAAVYENAKTAAEADYKARLLPLTELEANVKAAKAELVKAEQNLENIRKTFDSYGNMLYNKICGNMDTIRRRIDDAWPKHAADAPPEPPGGVLGMAFENMLKAIPIDSSRKWANEKLKEHLDKYIRYAEPFFKDYLEIGLKTLNKEAVDDISEGLAKALGTQIDQIASIVDAADAKYTGVSHGQEDRTLGAGDWFKTAVNALNMDFDSVGKSATGSQGWGDFLKDSVTHVIFEGLLWAVFGPIALAGEVIFQIVNLKKNGRKLADTQMAKVKQGYDEHIRTQFEIIKNELPAKITAELNSDKKKLTDVIESELNVIQQRMDDAIREHKQEGFNAEERKQSDDRNLAVIKQNISGANEIMFGSPLTDAGIIEAAQYALKSSETK